MSMAFLLDTDTCIYALNQNANVIQRLLATSREDVVVSAITEGELRASAAKSESPIRTLRRMEGFLAPLATAEFTSQDAVVYSQVRARLDKAGAPIGPLDTLIAAQAIARDLTLVTNNEREFRRVHGLRVENWRS